MLAAKRAIEFDKAVAVILVRILRTICSEKLTCFCMENPGGINSKPSSLPGAPLTRIPLMPPSAS
jgi:hypothetical protein